MDKWHYTIGGKNVPGCPDIASPSFFLKTDTGSLTVKLVTESNGCISEKIKTDALKNNGPVGSFTYNNNCNNSRSVTFKGVAKKATSFKWEFGDTQSNTSDLEITYIYPSEGNYTVKLITFNGVYSDTTIRLVKVRDHQPSLPLRLRFVPIKPFTSTVNSQISYLIPALKNISGILEILHN
ncbi:MAG: PKD domain-containing protein [Bacteroidales bacterium]|nr:PKD domain-containing protein [Bacteroidales bacterium]